MADIRIEKIENGETIDDQLWINPDVQYSGYHIEVLEEEYAYLTEIRIALEKAHRNMARELSKKRKNQEIMKLRGVA